MSVFTTVTFAQMQGWLAHFAIGQLQALKGIAAGITNTNYFVTTDQGRFVLTLFEKASADDLHYFVALMKHLAERGVRCPNPIGDTHGEFMGVMNGKPALLVNCLQGADIEQPNAKQCAEVGAMLAQMHVAGASFNMTSHNQRDDVWRQHTAELVIKKLNADQANLLQSELAFQAQFNDQALPRGVVHGDLFRDNVLFDGDHLGGFIDLYYACDDVLLYDVAIAVNDWCIDDNGALNADKLDSFLQAYINKRPFVEAEYAAWGTMLRRAALRFWLSRLYDFYFPQAGELTHAKDPAHFEHVLRQRLALVPAVLQLEA
jgi:homoserine kinase type II